MPAIWQDCGFEVLLLTVDGGLSIFLLTNNSLFLIIKTLSGERK